MARRREPRWVSRVVLDAVHEDQLREHGGLSGLRDEHALEAALARPRQTWLFSSTADIPALAASLGFGLAHNHPYRDGNERIAFLAIVTFLGINSYGFDATDEDVVTTMLTLADGRVTEAALAEWVRRHSTRRRGGPSA